MKLTSIRASIQLGSKNIPTWSTGYQKMGPSASFASCLAVIQGRTKLTVRGSRKAFGRGTSSKVVVQKSKGNSQLISRPKPTKVYAHFAHFSYAHFAKASGHVDVLLDKVKRSALIQEKEGLQQN